MPEISLHTMWATKHLQIVCMGKTGAVRGVAVLQIRKSDIGIGRFRILGGGGGVRILVGQGGGHIPSRHMTPY